MDVLLDWEDELRDYEKAVDLSKRSVSQYKPTRDQAFLFAARRVNVSCKGVKRQGSENGACLHTARQDRLFISLPFFCSRASGVFALFFRPYAFRRREIGGAGFGSSHNADWCFTEEWVVFGVCSTNVGAQRGFSAKKGTP